MNPFDSEVFQFVISDAGPEGKFVLDLKNAAGQQKLGRRVERSGSQTKTRRSRSMTLYIVILSDAGLA